LGIVGLLLPTLLAFLFGDQGLFFSKNVILDQKTLHLLRIFLVGVSAVVRLVIRVAGVIFARVVSLGAGFSLGSFRRSLLANK
jgi:hypothetical protein